jgi:hypothetical protein
VVDFLSAVVYYWSSNATSGSFSLRVDLSILSRISIIHIYTEETAVKIMRCFSLCLSLLTPIALGSSIPHEHVKRGAETNATLYAYGTNASSWPIAYGRSDGMKVLF